MFLSYDLKGRRYRESNILTCLFRLAAMTGFDSTEKALTTEIIF